MCGSVQKCLHNMDTKMSLFLTSPGVSQSTVFLFIPSESSSSGIELMEGKVSIFQNNFNFFKM